MATRPPERLWFDDFYVVAVDLGVNVSDLFLDVVERRRLVIGDNCETGQKERIPRRYFVDRPRSMVVPPYRIDLRKAVLFVGERPRWKNIKVQGAILQSIQEWEDNPHDPRDNFASDSIAKTSFVVPMRYIDEEPWVMVDEIFVERVDRGDVYYVPKDPEWLPPINPKNEPEALQNQEPTMQEDPPADSSTDESSSRPPNSPAGLELSGLVATLWRDMVEGLGARRREKERRSARHPGRAPQGPARRVQGVRLTGRWPPHHTNEPAPFRGAVYGNGRIAACPQKEDSTRSVRKISARHKEKHRQLGKWQK